VTTRRFSRVRRAVVALSLLAAIVVFTESAGAQPSSASTRTDVGTTYYPITGYGSTWSAIALQQWARNVYNNYRWQINYNDDGSSAGRQIFGQQGGGADFAVSEIPYALTNSDSADPAPSRHFAYMPIVAGGTSFMYNLVIAGKRVTNLRLDGATLAKIFTGVITKWNDPAIVADNPDLALPAITIIPVVRSDGSGTSAQFSAWMRSQYPAIWNAYCAKVGRTNCGITSNYPTIAGSAFVAQSGSDGVAGYVTQSQYVGAIGYDEYAYALNAQFPVVKLLNAAGYYTEPTAPNVAVALLAAQINNDPTSPDYLTQQLGSVYTNPDPRTYPLSSYSYMIIPTALEYGFTNNKGLTLAAFADYFLCQGQQQAAVLGYSPLPINLAEAGLSQVLKIPGGNDANISIASCNNPTFSADGSNKLADTAPQPQACDKAGPTQCLTGTGGAKAATVASTGAASVVGGATSTGAAGTAIASTGASSASGTAIASTGASSATGATTDSSGRTATPLISAGSDVVAGTPTTISSVSPVPGFETAAVVGIALVVVAVIFAPVIVSRRRLRVGRRPRGPTPRRVIPRIHLPAWGRTRAPRSIASEEK
jgi:phosphate ABC transporter phosphate-binding protein